MTIILTIIIMTTIIVIMIIIFIFKFQIGLTIRLPEGRRRKTPTAILRTHPGKSIGCISSLSDVAAHNILPFLRTNETI
jgi:hypothetical protein